MDSDAMKLFGVFLAMGAAGSIVYGIVSLINVLVRRLSSRVVPAVEGLEDELADLRMRVEEGEALRGRLAELEERLDFTERVLAREREPQRLPGGGER